MTGPAIDVIVPVYNGARYLGEAVASALGQTYAGAVRVTVVDDGSTDGSSEVAARFAGVRVVRQQNAGPSEARNRGLAETTAPLVAFLDADDVWPDGRLARLGGVLDGAPDLDAVMGQLRMVRMTDGRLEPIMPPQFMFQFGTALVRRPVFDLVGPIDPTLRYSEDMDWFMRAREAGVRIARLAEVVYLYRQHPDSITAGRGASDLLIPLAIKRSLDRRRAAGGTDLPDLPVVS